MTRSPVVAIALTALVLSTLSTPHAHARGWPQRQGDASRSGRTDERLSPPLARSWTWSGPAPAPAWPSAPRLDFDAATPIVVDDGVVVIASSADDAVRALDAASGRELWTVRTEGPVRVAPAIAAGKVLVASDDGRLRVLSLRDGGLLREERAGPSTEQVLGNDRVISAWPVRGGPAVVDGTVYWAAGIWPSDGIFVIASDVETGERRWTNDREGDRFLPQPHGGAEAASGLSAQGHLTVVGDTLLVPTGRAVPAALRREDGEYRWFHLQRFGQAGGSAITGLDGAFHNGNLVFDAVTGDAITKLPGRSAATADGVVVVSGMRLSRHRWTTVEKVDRKGEKSVVRALEPVWTAEGAPSSEASGAIAVTAEHVVVGGAGGVALFDLESGERRDSVETPGATLDLAVADGRVYASTSTGHVVALAPAAESVARDEGVEARSDPESVEIRAEITALADAILAELGTREGWAVDLGCGSGELAAALALRSQLRVQAIDPDAGNVERARRRLAALGLYGTRVAVHHGDPGATRFPKLFANLVVSGRSVEDPTTSPPEAEVDRLLRPWGGLVALGSAQPGRPLDLRRRGALEGAGEWTHQYSDAANSCCSTDTLVEGPLRMLWFRDADLPMPQRHGRAPAPLFHEGWLVVEGLEALRCVDAYNGRTVWERSLPGVLTAFDQDHLMGAAGTGSNICIGDESVYVHLKRSCLRLDLKTGEQLGEFPTPPRPDGEPGTWGYLASVGDLLYGTVADTDHIVKWRYLKGDMSELFTESFSLFALDRRTGEPRWTYRARHSIRHNAIAIGGDRVYLIDRELAEIDRVDFLRGKEEEPPEHTSGELVALDAATGEIVWRVENDVFGTMLALSVEEGALLMSYQPTRFRLPSETGGRMAVFHVRDGYRLWDEKVDYASRPLINGKTIYAQGGGWDLRTGVARPFPMQRSYGCGILAGSRSLMLFRSATMGYWDLRENRATRNYGGMRLGCWINAIPVGGIVLVPDGSAGCSCSYLNRASIALQSAE